MRKLLNENKEDENKHLKIYGLSIAALTLTGFLVYKFWGNNKLDIIEDKPKILFTKDLLKKNFDSYAMEYTTHKLSNHLSHALVVLCYLGATKKKLQDYFNKYSRKLENKSKKLGLVITKENYKNQVGNSESYSDLLHFFKNQLENEGTEKVLENYLPFISSGVIGAAFHGIIQLGFSFEKEIGDWDQISMGLAYSVIVNENVGELNKDALKEIPALDSIVKILDGLRQDKELDALIDPKRMNGFSEKVKAVKNNSYAIEKISKYDLNVIDNPQNAQKMMNTMMKLAYFIGLDHFFVIHLVTSFRAIKNVLRYLWENNKNAHFSLINNYWRSVLISYLVLQRPEVNTERTIEHKDFDWDKVIKNLFVREGVDEHTLKLVYVAYEEYKEVKEDKHLVGLGETFYYNFAKTASLNSGWKF